MKPRIHSSAHWLGDGSPAHGFQSLLSLSTTQALRCLQPFQVRLTASIAVGRATGRQHVQVMLQQSKGRSESKDGIGSTPMPATQPHPLVMVGHHNANKQREAMTSKESRTLRFTLSAEVIGNENATHSIIGEFIVPLGASDDLVYSVNLPGGRLGECTALAARIACQSIDVALKRHIERGGSDTVEMVDGLHIDPNGNLQDAGHE